MDPQLVTRAADVLLADGRIASIRPMVGEDEADLIALHDGVGDDNLRLRFFSLNREAAHRYVEHLVHGTGTTVATLVATVRDRIVAVATAERTGTDAAEVALLVADDEHGHGLGSLLLEHLAAACRDNGVRRFVAEVLPENAAMIRVFGDVGFEVSRRSASGVVIGGDEHRAPRRTRSRPPTCARRSRRRARWPRCCTRGCRRGRGPARRRRPGTRGARVDHPRVVRRALFVVHPEVSAIDDVTAFPRLADVPEHVDLAIIAVPAARVLAAVEDAAAAGVSSVVVISSGFGELGPEGAEIQRQMVRVARRNNIRLVGPNCLGVMSNDPSIRLNATFSLSDPPPGGLAVASQSGGVGIALLDVASELGLGVHAFVSLGNKADVSGNDLLAAWIDDPHVTAAALYLESFGNAPKFARLARRFAERKPLLAVVGGTIGRRSAGRGLAHRRGRLACGRRRRPLRPGRRHPVPQRRGDGPDRAPAVRAAAARRDGGSPSSATPVGSASLPPTLRTRRGWSSRSCRPSSAPDSTDSCPARPAPATRSTSARAPRRRTSPASSNRCWTAPRSTSCSSSLVPTSVAPADPSVEATARARAAQPDKPVVLVGLGGLGAAGPGRHRLPRGRPRDRGHRSGSRLRRVAANAARRARRPRPGPRVPCPRGRTGPARTRAEPAGWAPDDVTRLLDPYGLVPVGGLAGESAGGRRGWPRGSGSRSRSRSRTGTSCTRPTVGWSGSGSSPQRRSSRPPAPSDASSATTTCPCSSSPWSAVSRSHWAWSAIPGSGPSSWWRPAGSPPASWMTAPSCCPRSPARDAARAIRSLRTWPMLDGYRGRRARADTDRLEHLLVTLGELAVEVPEVAELDLNPVMCTPTGRRPRRRQGPAGGGRPARRRHSPSAAPPDVNTGNRAPTPSGSREAPVVPLTRCYCSGVLTDEGFSLEQLSEHLEREPAAHRPCNALLLAVPRGLQHPGNNQ